MAQVQTGGKSKTPAAVAAKGAPKGKPEQAAEKAGSTAIVTLKKGALSLDVGPSVIAAMDQMRSVEEDIQRLGEGLKTKSYATMAQLTAAVVKAAKADDKIDLAIAFAGDPKKMGSLNDLLGLALGFREIVATAPDKNGVAYDKIVTAKAVAKYFPVSGDDPKSDEYKKKNTLRSNFLHQLKKCTQAAAAIIEKDITARFDAKQGTLVISGPAVKKQFGQDNIALDERKTRGEGDNKVELNEKPSFTALAAMGAEANGAVVVRGSTSRGAKIVGAATAAANAAAGTGKMTAGGAIVSISKSLVKAIEMYAEKVTPEVEAALESVANAIEVKLGNA